jgi:hypothetical protein
MPVPVEEGHGRESVGSCPRGIDAVIQVGRDVVRLFHVVLDVVFQGRKDSKERRILRKEGRISRKERSRLRMEGY